MLGNHELAAILDSDLEANIGKLEPFMLAGEV